jgi:hypothetical protein
MALGEATDAAPRGSILALVARGFVYEECPALGPAASAQMEGVILSLIAGTIDHDCAAQLCLRLTGTRRPMDRLSAILQVGDDPLPGAEGARAPGAPPRKKNELWSESEDTRLLAGIHRFGVGAWGSIARFVGNNRVKTQCCQRWSRGLDPRIKRTMWTAAEDKKLLALVAQLGRKSWTRISLEFGDRCDIQCRYRFHQLCPAERKAKIALPSIHSFIA